MPQLRYRSTFIEATASPSDGDLSSPREVLSDPGSICSREAAASTDTSGFFCREKTYVAKLSNHIKQGHLSSQNTDSGPGHAGGLSESADLSQTQADAPSSDPNDFSQTMADVESEVASRVSQSSAGQCSSLTQMAEHQANAEMMAGLGLRQKLVSQSIRQKAGQANDLLAWQRISTALTSIQEIPEQVEQVLQQRATTVMDQMQDEVAVMKQAIDTDGEQVGTEKAKQSVAVIPDLVMDSFSANIAKAMSSVRFHVEGVMSGLEADAVGGAIDGGSGYVPLRVVQEIQDIPSQVRQIAADAVEKAVEDSQEQVAQQLGQARCSVPKQAAKKAMLDAEYRALERAQDIFDRVPRGLPHETLEDNVEQILDDVQKSADGSMVPESALPNRDVADALLRAKAGVTEALAGRGVCNPGSVGHPELCSRPCLFFSAGNCSNGLSCPFCHAPHPRRAAHLDKRNRSLLQKLDLADRFVVIAPILRQKLQCIEFGANLIEDLDRLREQFPDSNPNQMLMRSRQARDTKSLSVALQCMTARSLLALLSHTPVCKDSAKHQAVANFLEVVSNTIRPEEDADLADVEKQSHISDLADVEKQSHISDSQDVVSMVSYQEAELGHAAMHTQQQWIGGKAQRSIFGTVDRKVSLAARHGGLWAPHREE